VVDSIEEIEVGYHIRTELHGRGHATEAATAVRELAFGRLACSRIVAIIDPSNAPSQRVAEKLELTLERAFERAGGPRLLYAAERGS
jgi:RimJ/RimL family protein N-acetyltransferase